MISFPSTEVQWLRFHGGSGYLDDPRRPFEAPSDRKCTPGVFSDPSVFEQEKTTLRHHIEECSQGTQDNSAV